MARFNRAILLPVLLLCGSSWLASLSFTGGSARVNVERARVLRKAEYSTVAVPGATGRLGRFVVEELLKDPKLKILAMTRNTSRAEEFLPVDERIQVLPWTPEDEATAMSAFSDADVAIWCAEGRQGLTAMSKAFASRPSRSSGSPRVVMCSSAAVTRPTWSEKQKSQFSGAADIPIVRLNPGGLLDEKRNTEEVLRKSGASYTVARPTGLKDEWPSGRPVLSQGDVAVGRTSRQDLASFLVRLLDEPLSTGKTFELLTVPGYPKPRSYDQALERLRPDSVGPVSAALARVRSWFGGQDEKAATYGVLQQLLPGEEQDSAGLAMGQTYEQYDKKEEGRLGPRGSERVPATFGS